MKNKLFCNREPQPRSIKAHVLRFLLGAALCLVTYVPLGAANNDAPQWMHALVNAPLPAHDEKTNAVLLYAEQNVTVLSTDKIKIQVRKAYKILRPDGRAYGDVFVPFNSPGQKITSLHGWCIPDMPTQNGAPIYNKPEAERAWGKLVTLYKVALA